MTQLVDSILERLLNSYPCRDCNRYERYLNKLKNVKKDSQYGSLNKKIEESINQVHSSYLNHIEEKHLPNEKEWEILRKP